MKELLKIVERFEQLPNASVGCGPDHPVHPDYAYSASIDELLATYPQLVRYSDYITFLRHYAGGALAGEQSPAPFLAIYGFGEFDDDVADGATEDNFYVFAESYSDFDLGKTACYAFAFNICANRRDGVYRAHIADADDLSHAYQPFCSTFGEWFQQLVDRRGVFLELDSMGNPI